MLHVIDNKSSHKDPKVVHYFLDNISKSGYFITTRGTEYEFIGMALKIDKKIEVKMKERIQGAIELFEETGKTVDGKVSSPALPRYQI